MRTFLAPIAAAALVATGWPARAQNTSATRALLDLALRGPRTPFMATQRTSLALDGGGLSTGEVRLRADGSGAELREYLSGRARGVALLHVNGRVWERGADGTWTRLPDSPESDPALVRRLILANYRVSVAPAAPILRRVSVAIRIEPRHACNPSRRLWLEQATGIILRDELYAPDGRLRSSTQMTSIQTGPQSEALFHQPARSSKGDLFGPSSLSPRPSKAQVEQETGRPVRFPAIVPAGYQVALYGVMVTGSGRLMPVVRYTDGLSAFTIFQRGRGPRAIGSQSFRRLGRGPNPAADRRPAPQCIGEGGLQQSVVSVTGLGSNYLLVGDLAERELERVARSLP